MTTHSLLVKRLHSANPEVAITEEPKPEARIKQLFSSKTTLLQFLTNKDGKPMSDRQINALEQKYGKHPLSLWRDQSLLERQLEDAEGTIFDIIMPWVKEQENELNKDKTPEEQNQKPKGPTQSTLSFAKKTPTTPITTQIQTPKKPAVNSLSSIEKEAELKCRSQVIELPAVEDFDFVFTDKEFPIKGSDDCQYRREITDVEGILIHANWADYNIQIDKEIPSDESQAEVKRRASLKKMNLRIPDTVMKDGILFIWVEKEFTNDVIVFFECQGFAYVENLCYVMLDKAQKESTMLRKTTDATSAIARKPYKFLTKSHRTLLMLRRVKYDTCSLDSKFGENQKPLSGVTPIDNKDRLELRHQRTGDVVFDWADDNDSTKTPQYYIYKMIETLLPKAMNKVTQAEIQDKQFERARKFKLVELWATDKSPRKGWLKVCQQKE